MKTFFENLESQITQKHLLNHSFYKAWSQGRLTNECLKDYAMEYYHHVRAFPKYLSALHSHTQDTETSKSLLQNLLEEEGGSPNHPELWKQFTLSLGVCSADIDNHQSCREIDNVIHSFKKICLGGSVAEGLAALYSYESQIPSICYSKIDGLKKHYSMKEKDWVYFSVHIKADEEHARVEKQLLAKHVHEKNEELCLNASQVILDALWNFLSYLSEKYHLECA